jgi:glycosyltransferase involved in cell wall biosynthesis
VAVRREQVAQDRDTPGSAAPPELTVVIPVWDDYVRVVGEAVESVLVQQVDVAVLVVDNASSQPLPALPRCVTVVRLPERLSVGAARNEGLSLVRTEFVLFLDADDLVVEGAIPHLLARLKARPDYSACVCAIVAWNAATGELRPLDFPSRRTHVVARWPGCYRLYAAIANRMPTTGCVLMRTMAAMDAGGFTDANFAEDWPLNVGLAFRGPIEFLPSRGRLLRVHAKSLRARPRSRAEIARAFDLMRERLKADPSVPTIVRLGLPLIALHHVWQVRRVTPGGTTGPGLALAAVGDGGLFRTGRTG